MIITRSPFLDGLIMIELLFILLITLHRKKHISFSTARLQHDPWGILDGVKAKEICAVLVATI